MTKRNKHPKPPFKQKDGNYIIFFTHKNGFSGFYREKKKDFVERLEDATQYEAREDAEKQTEILQQENPDAMLKVQRLRLVMLDN